MLKVLPLAFVVLFAQPALALTDRFAPDNPWYEQFAQDCRIDANTMHPECIEGVYQAFGETSTSQEFSCDFSKFWAVSDEKMKDEYFPVLPWQYGVEAIVSEPGVCTSY